jgi:hypothetical protein
VNQSQRIGEHIKSQVFKPERPCDAPQRRCHNPSIRLLLLHLPATPACLLSTAMPILHAWLEISHPQGVARWPKAHASRTVECIPTRPRWRHRPAPSRQPKIDLQHHPAELCQPGNGRTHIGFVPGLAILRTPPAHTVTLNPGAHPIVGGHLGGGVANRRTTTARRTR